MMFSSLEYLLFFVIVLGLLAVIKGNALKKYFLLVASIFFYSCWDYRFAVLLLLLTLFNQWVAVNIERSDRNKARKVWLVTAIIFDIIILGFFKYFNFFVDSANTLLSGIGLDLPVLDIILPVGISFVTFEVLSYTVDVYRRDVKPFCSSDFLLMVLFFPHLVAGPILKPRHFLPQLQQEIRIKKENVIEGAQIFVFGLVKKIVIADRMAQFSDPVFNQPDMYGSVTVWLAVIAYAIQIYCDFSGYSDMAIGSARCMGFTIPQNFNMPYLSLNITEFWRRWHISLSTWLREYVYFSLGGNRKGKVKQYVNLILVMVIGGLWHGASWNFIFWGLLNGIALAFHKFYADVLLKKKRIDSLLYRILAWLLTFSFICLTWVFFRSPDFATSWMIMVKMFVWKDGLTWMFPYIWFALTLMIVGHFVGSRIEDYPQVNLRTFWGLIIFFFVLLGVLYLMPVASTPFIYFQF